MKSDKSFVSYKEDNDEIVSGYFEIIKEADNYLKFKSGTNRITMPWNRILKFKENSNDMKGGKI